MNRYDTAERAAWNGEERWDLAEVTHPPGRPEYPDVAVLRIAGERLLSVDGEIVATWRGGKWVEG